VAVITKMRKFGDSKLRTRLLLRPEEVGLGMVDEGEALYWSEEVTLTPVEDVKGKATVLPRQMIKEALNRWLDVGEFRFYLAGAWIDGRVETLPEEVVKAYASYAWPNSEASATPKLERPLRCLDVFAGAGGLSEGLRASGVCQSDFAIEHDEAAAKAFAQNHPESEVLNDDW